MLKQAIKSQYYCINATSYNVVTILTVMANYGYKQTNYLLFTK